jgi:hypothetical protein
MINEQRRGQLDTIVQEMTINREKPETIQFVVDDFKNKYDEPAVEQPKKDGLLKTIGKGILKPFGEVGVGVYNAAKATADLARGDYGEAAQELKSSRNLPFLGETKPFMEGDEDFGEFTKKTVGYGLDIGSNVVGGFGAGQVVKSGFKGALKAGILSGIKTGASTGALVGAGKSLEENKDALNVLGDTLGGAVSGGATGGILGGATATAGKVIRGVLQPGKTVAGIGKGIKEAGESIQQRVIKPTQKDIKAGFKIENVSKYDVGGNLGDSFVRVKDQIKSNMEELNNIVSTIAPKKRYKFDLENYVDELESKYKTGGVQLLGQGKKVLSEVENLKGELDLALGNNWRDNLSGFEDVLDIKRRAGLNAAFMHDITKSQPTPEEKVWTDFYMLLKDKLEKEAPPEFQAVNRRLSDLIPIEQALIRRIPIAERQNVLNVADIVSLSASAIDPRALTIGVLNRVLKSGTVANKLMQAGSKIEGAGAKLTPTDELIKSIPKNQQGFTKNPFSSPAVGKTADNPLIKEAKKYKSAEEFVKAQGTPVYHGTDVASIIEKEGFKKMPIKTGVSAFGEGSYFTSKIGNAEGYGEVVKAFLKKDIKLKKVFDSDAYKVDTQKLIKDGYYGTIMETGNGNNIVIFDNANIKTKSQLIDIWNKANK